MQRVLRFQGPNLHFAVVLLFALIVFVGFAYRGMTTGRIQPRQQVTPSCATADRFVERAGSLGIHFQYENGAAGDHIMTEFGGGGAAIGDFNNDGLPDLYFVQGGATTVSTVLDENRQDSSANVLYSQLPTGEFRESTTQSGLDDRDFGHGVAVGDFDNDGFQDVLVTTISGARLFWNCGDGTFQPVALDNTSEQRAWSISAAWGDLDSDGDLDVYVANYVDYDDGKCRRSDGTLRGCLPQEYKPTPDFAFRNEDSQFVRAEQEWGLHGGGNRALGVVICDFDGDRWQDIYVANDMTANFLFRNQHGEGFLSDAIAAGCAISGNGYGQASMGVACGDFDQNGRLDIYLTHYVREYDTLYSNGEFGFEDVSQSSGLAELTMPYLSFGVDMADYDGDGQQEVFVASGHINPTEDEAYEMPPRLYEFNGDRWENASDAGGDYFNSVRVGRGVARGDLNLDGRPDLVVVHQHTPVAVLMNAGEQQAVRVRLIGTRSNRNGIGSVVGLQFGESSVTRHLIGGGSYASANEGVLTFSVPKGVTHANLTVAWPVPGDAVEVFRHVRLTGELCLIQGRSSVVVVPTAGRDDTG